MLSVYGSKTTRNAYCDQISRRGVLKIGALGVGAFGLNMADVLRAEAKTGSMNHKAVINIFLGGGPPHQDMWEIKTEAPKEIRGPFQPISTNVSGIQIGECFPKIASIADKSAFLRAVVGCEGRHDSFQCMTGWRHADMRPLGGRPALGSVMHKLKGPVDPSVPPYIGMKTDGVWRNPGTPGFLGSAYGPFIPDGQGLNDMKLNGITTDRLSDRKQVLASIDRLRRNADADGSLEGLDAYQQQAFDVLTSSKLVDALDLSKEDPKIRARYGDGKPYTFKYDGAETNNELVLQARRLVEVGVRCVTLTYGRWDSHGDNEGLVRHHGVRIDQAVHALVTDLEERGMLDDVTVLVWGEFGRTPRINGNAGRDHWPQVSCAYMAGGGMQTGQAIGSTNRLGEHAHSRPVHVQEIFATLYHNLGIDISATTITDPTGRPQYLTQRDPIRELV
ncbi:MAG: DUF1501 domain-containing protein [Pirellulales bacterium]|nr:DUF1501 domain-containing protein [Pirellulales bacterium]|tara:strand:- start:4987 stop:6327 length:1341 start_codon:yes stop_codon:yes gene_type:complete